MAPLRVHDHQHRSLWLRGERHVRRSGAALAGPPSDRFLRRSGPPLRRDCTRRLRACPSDPVQRARDHLGSAADPLPACGLCRPGRALLLRCRLHRAGAVPARSADRASLRGRSRGRRSGRARDRAGAVLATPGCLPGGGGRARHPRRRECRGGGAVIRLACRRGGARGHGGGPALPLGRALARAAHLALQGSERRSRSAGRHRCGPALGPARAPARRGEPDHPLPARAGAEPERHRRAAAAARAFYRCGVDEPNHGIRRRSLGAGLSRLHHGSTALPSPCQAGDAHSGRGRRGAHLAGALPWSGTGGRGRVEPAGDPAGRPRIRGFLGRDLHPPAGPSARGRGTQLRRRHESPL